VLCALLSSFTDIPIPSTTCFAGEVGLSGEIRSVHRVEQRISEAEKLGLEKILISRFGQKGNITHSGNIEIVPLARVEDVYHLLFG
jgi:DNA repair protein RadA/Sms